MARLGRRQPNSPVVVHPKFVAPAGGAIVFRGTASDGQTNNVNISLTTPSSMQVGDLIVLVQADNFHTLSNLSTPTGTAASSWTEQTSARYDGGTDNMHCKVWTASATAAGAQSVNVNFALTDNERYGAIFVFGNAAFDVGTSTAQASATSWAAGGVTTTGTDDYLIVSAGTLNSGGNGNTNFTFPGGMTATTEFDVDIFATYRSGYEQLAASGSTGTRTISLSTAKPGFTVTVAAKSTDAAAVPGPIYSISQYGSFY